MTNNAVSMDYTLGLPQYPAVLMTGAENRRQHKVLYCYVLRSVGAQWSVEDCGACSALTPALRCNFVIGPDGYRSIRIQQRNSGAVVAGAEVSGALAGQGARVYPAPGVKTPPLLLVDGPNPLFNYFNALHLLGMRPGQKRVVPVYRCHTDGSVGEESYLYSFDDSTITVRRAGAGFADILDLDERYALRRVRSGHSDIVFSRFTPLYLN